MIRPGLVIPQVVGYGALALGLGALVSGVGFYFNTTNRIDNLESRVRTIEATAVPALGDIRASMARMEAQLAILLSERRSPPYVPGGIGSER